MPVKGRMLFITFGHKPLTMSKFYVALDVVPVMKRDMEKETIVDNLEKLLMAIHKQVVGIRDTDEKIPKIEMDKTLSNIRALYEQFTVLNYLNSHPGELRATEAPVQLPKPEPEIFTPQKETPFVPIVEKRPEPEIPSVVIPEPAPVQVPPVVEIPQAPPVQVAPPAEVPVPKPEPEAVKPLPQEKPEDEPYRPKITAPAAEPVPAKPAAEIREASTLADKLRMQKLDDLHKAVSLSDKFLYINELFKSDADAYRNAVDELNRHTQLSEAESRLRDLAARFGWDEHPKTEKKFRELVARKFI